MKCILKRAAALAGVLVLSVYTFGSTAVAAEETTAATAEAAAPVKDQALSNLVDGWPQMSDINEETGFLMDADNLGVLYSLNASTIRYPASTTKIMTALLVIENANLQDTVTMTDAGIAEVVAGSSNARTVLGEEFTVEQCLYILMLKSANDIANQLAEHVGGTMDHFIEMMNERAAELGCKNTHFANPSGMPGSEHYTTATDLALIMRECIQNETFLKIVGTTSYTVPPTNKTSTSRTYENHNKLIISGSEYYYEYCLAGKTGYTDAAWRTYVAAARKNDRTLIVVLMRGPDKTDFLDAASLFEYGFNEFEKKEWQNGTINIPVGMSTDNIETVTSAAEDGSLSEEYYYNGLKVGSGSTPVPVISEAENIDETAADSDPEADTMTEEDKAASTRARRAFSIVAIIILVFALLMVLYNIYVQKERQRRKRRRKK